MTEIWKDIEGYENLYQVSSLGRVKSLGNGKTSSKERFLKADKNKQDYLRVTLCKDGKVKRYAVHRLVAIAFLPNPYNLPQVNHKDEDRTNNTVENLEWCDCQYNINYGTRTKRMAEKRSKSVICIETGKIFNSIIQVERDFGISHSHISKCCLGKQKTCGGFHWRYTE